MKETNLGTKDVTGVMIQYLKSCKRELWFFAHNINMNREDENIRIGRQIHEESYSRERKNIRIGPISIDFSKKGDTLQVFEVKKSSKLKEPPLYQLYYYLWFLKNKGVNAEGFLVYPKENRRERVELSEEIEDEIEQILVEIRNTVSRDTPPPAEDKPYCNNCSYYEFCRV